jgi:hypothetical protein
LGLWIRVLGNPFTLCAVTSIPWTLLPFALAVIALYSFILRPLTNPDSLLKTTINDKLDIEGGLTSSMVEMLNEEEEKDENGSGEDSVNFEDVIRRSYTLTSSTSCSIRCHR